MSTPSTVSVIVHGHFYQPPRENPWTDEVEQQPSAAPHHDWNQRIAAECYAPNAWARLLDHEGRIVKLVNNYAGISFDIGPTLFRWLERNSPGTVRRIIEGDRDSVARYGGHGNALAHPYVHAILPLVDPKDRATLVKWGIAEFTSRFGREPEGLWLPETGVDLATLSLLSEHGIRYAVLAPWQAIRVRPLGGERWHELGSDWIDPSHPYRCRLPHGRAIDLFFYDAGLSRAIAFEGLLQGADRLAGRLAEVARSSPSRLHILCTDGESYGHHTRFGERALAVLLTKETVSKEFAVTNFGAYLASVPPTHEVVIRDGSAWSCAHGLGRWKEDCGCSTGGQPGWRQGWRAPFREAINSLRNDLHRLFAEQADRLFTDAWAARDDYIALLLDRSNPSIEEFFDAHARRSLLLKDRAEALQLLEMQRHVLLMQSSDGWFFSDMSDIEAVQNLTHAARALDLASAYATVNLEARFLARLHAAKSNLAAERDGRRIWEVRVRSARADFARPAVLYAIRSLAANLPEPYRVYTFDLHRLSLERFPFIHGTTLAGGVEVCSSLTLERKAFGFVLKWLDADGIAGHLFPWEGEEDLRRRREACEGHGEGVSPPNDTQATPISFKMLSPEERQEVLMALYAGWDVLRKRYDELATKTQGLLRAFLDGGVAPPEALRAPTAFTVSRTLEESMRQWLSEGGTDLCRSLLLLADDAKRLNLPQQAHLQDLLFGAFGMRLRRLRERPDLDRLRELRDVVDLADRLGYAIEQPESIVLMYALLTHDLPPLIERTLQTESREQCDLVSAVCRLGERFGFSTGRLRQRLRPFEERLAADPGLWP
jgi:alpha-amylase/alpha-mannosidase (GH57 family)